ncbi:MAG TPA: helix-turn-helix domain-containing protein [Thermoanaerobaculia bacterium]|nr:helix-turn-helix domain-containing protein [Thermoanaerobaculia bacterium]
MKRQRMNQGSSGRKGGPEFLSRGEAAKLFGVSASTVTRWARLGLLRALRTPGGHYRFPAEETRRAAQRSPADELLRLD